MNSPHFDNSSSGHVNQHLIMSSTPIINKEDFVPNNMIHNTNNNTNIYLMAGRTTSSVKTRIYPICHTLPPPLPFYAYLHNSSFILHWSLPLDIIMGNQHNINASQASSSDSQGPTLKPIMIILSSSAPSVLSIDILLLNPKQSFLLISISLCLWYKRTCDHLGIIDSTRIMNLDRSHSLSAFLTYPSIEPNQFLHISSTTNNRTFSIVYMSTSFDISNNFSQKSIDSSEHIYFHLLSTFLSSKSSILHLDESYPDVFFPSTISSFRSIKVSYEASDDKFYGDDSKITIATTLTDSKLSVTDHQHDTDTLVFVVFDPNTVSIGISRIPSYTSSSFLHSYNLQHYPPTYSGSSRTVDKEDSLLLSSQTSSMIPINLHNCALSEFSPPLDSGACQHVHSLPTTSIPTHCFTHKFTNYGAALNA